MPFRNSFKIWGKPFRLSFSLAVAFRLVGTILNAASSSTVLLIGFSLPCPAAIVAFKVLGSEPAKLVTKDLGGMARRKTTIAGLPHAVALERSVLQS